eukprot:336666-Rhodomonas_salina.1
MWRGAQEERQAGQNGTAYGRREGPRRVRARVAEALRRHGSTRQDSGREHSASPGGGMRSDGRNRAAAAGARRRPDEPEQTRQDARGAGNGEKRGDSAPGGAGEVGARAKSEGGSREEGCGRGEPKARGGGAVQGGGGGCESAHGRDRGGRWLASLTHEAAAQLVCDARAVDELAGHIPQHLARHRAVLLQVPPHALLRCHQVCLAPLGWKDSDAE